MAWKQNEDGEETIFVSQATNNTEIYDDLLEVVERMLTNKINENAADTKSILLYTNATNGYIRLVWFDAEKVKALGTFFYYLELPAFWELSLTHEEGAFHFDNESHIAICMMTEDFMDDFEVYTMNELNTTPELLLV